LPIPAIAKLLCHVWRTVATSSANKRTELSKLSIDTITGLTCEQLKNISGDEITVFKPRKLKAIAVELVSCIRPATLDELNKRQVNALTNEQMLV